MGRLVKIGIVVVYAVFFEYPVNGIQLIYDLLEPKLIGLMYDDE
jgi:hypothetical protein